MRLLSLVGGRRPETARRLRFLGKCLNSPLAQNHDKLQYPFPREPVWISVAAVVPPVFATIGTKRWLHSQEELPSKGLTRVQQQQGEEASQKDVEPMDKLRLYEYLQLQTFSETELEQVYQRIWQADPSYIMASMNTDDKNNHDDVEKGLEIPQITQFLLDRIREIEAEWGEPFRPEESQQQQQWHQQEQLEYAHQEALKFRRVFGDDRQPLTQPLFVQTITDIATALDFRRMWPITLSILLVGTSVGIVTPAMPFVVQNLSLTPGQYGTVVSAFALAKLSSNVPAAILVERHGRKPYLTFSLAVIAIGVGGVGAANTFEQLYACRLLTGAGVAALTTASQLMVTDVSTPLNRAVTMSPIVSAFAAGTALGPALGGILVDELGLQTTFYMVGSSYLGVALLNRSLLEETKRSAKKFYLPSWQHRPAEPDSKQDDNNNSSVSTANSREEGQEVPLTEATKDALSQWVPLFQNPKIRSALIISGFYWFSLAGSQMTLLPLILTDPNGLAMSASGVGQVYMLMSTVQVMSNPIMARYVIDRMGTTPSIAAGCAMISSAMTFLPFCTTTTTAAATTATEWYWLGGTLGLWAMGSSMLSTAPLAYITDKVAEDERAQAIAMLRTSGDVGFLLGSSCVGAFAGWTGNLGVAMQSSGGLLFAATLWFTTRQTLLNMKHNDSQHTSGVGGSSNNSSNVKQD